MQLRSCPSYIQHPRSRRTWKPTGPYTAPNSPRSGYSHAQGDGTETHRDQWTLSLIWHRSESTMTSVVAPDMYSFQMFLSLPSNTRPSPENQHGTVVIRNRKRPGVFLHVQQRIMRTKQHSQGFVSRAIRNYCHRALKQVAS